MSGRHGVVDQHAWPLHTNPGPHSPHRQQIKAKPWELCRFNQEVFGNQLPADLSIVWKKRLTTTAGRMNYSLDQTCATAWVQGLGSRI